jgi:hypothetical protein
VRVGEDLAKAALLQLDDRPAAARRRGGRREDGCGQDQNDKGENPRESGAVDALAHGRAHLAPRRESSVLLHGDPFEVVDLSTPKDTADGALFPAPGN